MRISRFPHSLGLALAIAGVILPTHDGAAAPGQPVYYGVPRGAHPHDVAAAPVPGGPVFYTAQSTGKVGVLDPTTGKTEEIALGPRSAPHGVIVGPDGAAWITDGGQNAIKEDPKTRQSGRFPSRRHRLHQLNTLPR